MQKKQKFDEHQKKRQDKKKIPKEASSPSSSDVSDTETDEQNSASFKEASEFLDLARSKLGLSELSDSKKQELLGDGDRVNITQLNKAVGKILKDQMYSTESLIEITRSMHSIFGKLQLKQKESFNILLTSKVMPDVESVDKQQAEFVVSRAFKYIILRRK